MKTGLTGTFVISWSQTELDGRRQAPRAAVNVGAAWRWAGDALRVDGPTGLLTLGDATGRTDLRKRAAQSVRGLLAAAQCGAPLGAALPAAAAPNPHPLTDESIVVTDGRATWTITLIDAGPAKSPLAMVIGAMPPPNTDLWVVSHSVHTAARKASSTSPGGVICFTPGTEILTEFGKVRVEHLEEGIRVQTKDDGCAPLVWVGSRRITGARLNVMPHLRPIRLREGALDRGVPDAPILVSPDHRMVLRGARARALFNQDEVLVAARDLINDQTVTVDLMVREVTYVHLLLPSHAIVFANGVETESFHPANAALSSMDDGHIAQLLDRVPEIAQDPHIYGAYARRMLSTSEAAILRHDMI